MATGQPGLTEHSDGGRTAPGGRVVPIQSRAERFTSTVHADFPQVTGTESEWKLSPVAIARPLIDGELDGSKYDLIAMESSGARIEWVPRSDPRIGSAGKPEDRAAANAWSSFDEALAVTVGGEEPVELTLTRNGMGPKARAAHTVITARNNSRGHIVLLNSGAALLAENLEIIVEDGAHLTVVSVQEWADDAIHLASQFATVGRDASLTQVIVSLGGAVIRVNPSVHLTGQGANADLFGMYFADAGQHIEHRIYLHHVAEGTKGRVNYKGALQGAGARTVWVGDVLIGPQASGTDSYEENRNLVLSEGARADSVPNLEIETGDIAGAGHASATGRFDDEQLFYLQSRGITEDGARRLVVLGFLTEIIQKVGRSELEARLQLAIDAELASGSAK